MLSIAQLVNKEYKCENKDIIQYINNGGYDEIVSYITNTIMPNCLIDITRPDVEELLPCKIMFVGECVVIIDKLIPIIKKFREVNSSNFVNLDITNVWFEKKVNVDIPNPFKNSPGISRILTIVFKITDLLNYLYFCDIDLLDRRNGYLNHMLETNDLNIFERNNINKMLENIKMNKEKIIESYKMFHNSTYVIRKYFIDLFDIINYDKNYLMFLPDNVYDIFETSIYFIDIDEEFVEFARKFYDWIPTEFRCKYITLLVKNKKIKDEDVKLPLFISDIITMYYKSLKDPSSFNNLNIIGLVTNCIIDGDRLNLWLINYDDRVKYVSIVLSIILKFVDILEKDKDNEDLIVFIMSYLKNIKTVLLHDMTLLNSYLVYQLYNTFYSLYKLTINEVDIMLEELFCILCENKMTTIYMACTLDDLSHLKIKSMNKEKYERLEKWFNIYKKIDDYDLIDPITSTVIVEPIYISMSEDDSILQVCDKNMLMSYLWSKPENPYTRKELSIEDLIEFNKRDDCIKLIKEFKMKLRDEFLKFT